MQSNNNSDDNNNNSVKEALPLGWTRVVRRRTTMEAAVRTTTTNHTATETANEDKDNNNDDNMEFYCCNDPQCRRRPQLFVETITEANLSRSSSNNKYTRIAGRAVVCLQDTDPEWFQGYFFDDIGNQQYGLLCQQQEIDACLQCSEGGYRELDMQATCFGDHNNKQQKSSYLLENIEWTGGDMMRLNTSANATAAIIMEAASSNNSKDHHHKQTSASSGVVRMQADTVWTGEKAVSRVERIFGSLLRNLRHFDEENDNEATSVLQLMPNVAVVAGTMELFLPKTTTTTRTSIRTAT